MKKLILILISIFALSCSNPDAPIIPTAPTCQTYEVAYKKTIVGVPASGTYIFNSNQVAWVQFAKNTYSNNCNDVGKIISTSSEIYTTTSGQILVMRKTVVE